MKCWIAGLAAVIMTAAVQAGEFAGKITAIEEDEDGRIVIIDGRNYRIDEGTEVRALASTGSRAVPRNFLAVGQSVRYSLGNAVAGTSVLDLVEISGPAAEVNRLVKSVP